MYYWLASISFPHQKNHDTHHQDQFVLAQKLLTKLFSANSKGIGINGIDVVKEALCVS
ncbi:16664_t:CDS:2 [Acaulospora morrowiae]|uniref:16664_t:CDS:1 n=1 Tax=Acaulospora morrowiae TaxID=94023 RepID=A0A9N9BAB8_9GLOM|nr:16664_t:CDS:2 [Acaulospora morrowiae]